MLAIARGEKNANAFGQIVLVHATCHSPVGVVFQLHPFTHQTLNLRASTPRVQRPFPVGQCIPKLFALRHGKCLPPPRGNQVQKHGYLFANPPFAQTQCIENKGFVREPEIPVDTAQPDKKPNQLARSKMRPMHARHDHRNERDAVAQKNSVV